MLLKPTLKGTMFLRLQNLSTHSRWNVYRGESKADSDMIFSAEKGHMFQFKTTVSVMLANKTRGNDHCDFKIKGSWSEGKCTIYMGDSSTIIAQVVLILQSFLILDFTIFMHWWNKNI